MQLTTAALYCDIVIHAYDVSLRNSKEKEQQLKSQLAKVQQESQDIREQLSKLEEEQQRLLQEVEQWKKMFHARGMQIPQLQNENKQLQDIKCECMCINYNVANKCSYYCSSYNIAMIFYYYVYNY